MQHETSRVPADEDDRIQCAILGLLLDPEAQRPWPVAEVEREIGNRVATVDALADLSGTGLVHRYGEFVTATRAAVHMDVSRFERAIGGDRASDLVGSLQSLVVIDDR